MPQRAVLWALTHPIMRFDLQSWQKGTRDAVLNSAALAASAVLNHVQALCYNA